MLVIATAIIEISVIILIALCDFLAFTYRFAMYSGKFNIIYLEVFQCFRGNRGSRQDRKSIQGFF